MLGNPVQEDADMDVRAAAQTFHISMSFWTPSVLTLLAIKKSVEPSSV